MSLFISYIYSSHFTVLSKPHRLNTSKKCIACECFGKRSSKTAAYTNVNNTQALVLYEKFGIGKSYGELICTSCRVNNLPAHVDRDREKEHFNAFEWFNCFGSADVSSESKSDSEEFRPSSQKLFYNNEEKKHIVNGKFYFKVSEFLIATQIRAFFSRQKAKHRRVEMNENDIEIEDEEFFKII